MKVLVRNNNVEKALKTLKRKTKENLLELRRRQHYIKPCERRNEAKQAAVVRERKRRTEEIKKYDKQF